MEMILRKARLSTFSTFKVFSFILGVFLFILLSAFFLPHWRQQLRSMIWGSDRKILATLVEDLERTGNPISVFKVSEKGNLYIELYSTAVPEELVDTLQSSSYQLLQTIELPGTIDGYVSFMGEATNLAVANLDDDPYLELIIPSYNYDFVASLDIIKYNPVVQKYELMKSFDIPEGILGTFSKESWE